MRSGRPAHRVRPPGRLRPITSLRLPPRADHQCIPGRHGTGRRPGGLERTVESARPTSAMSTGRDTARWFDAAGHLAWTRMGALGANAIEPVEAIDEARGF